MGKAVTLTRRCWRAGEGGREDDGGAGEEVRGGGRGEGGREDDGGAGIGVREGRGEEVRGAGEEVRGGRRSRRRRERSYCNQEDDADVDER